LPGWIRTLARFWSLSYGTIPDSPQTSCSLCICFDDSIDEKVRRAATTSRTPLSVCPAPFVRFTRRFPSIPNNIPNNHRQPPEYDQKPSFRAPSSARPPRLLRLRQARDSAAPAGARITSPLRRASNTPVKDNETNKLRGCGRERFPNGTPVSWKTRARRLAELGRRSFGARPAGR